MSRIFVILDADEVVNINFSEVIEDSAETLRFSLNGDKTIVKFAGETPDFLVGKTTHTPSEMLAILQTEEWSDFPDPPE